ncbi:heavy metal translocating P-type ATPase [Microterricola pindariensis]|uniref:Cadmium-translocating P-type ATPase n=1 Tax=Microterricola pindariensis TaxID=478010 RepID=A0ABX5AU10_9MICO|nr:heavy metal translocating P-type ATPase [Microterricola pindariensis]PPL16001.1 cadmium-translocating P-type ATPase [Microterricola pindariensis]
MAWIRTHARRYPLLATTLLVIVVGVVLWAAGWGTEPTNLVRWLFSGFALVVAAMQAVRMVRDIMRGHWGLDILAVTAIIATVLVNEYVASIVIVLMLTGGEALEDYAAGRAKRELNALLAKSPQSAHRVLPGGGIEEIPVSEVAVGDTLLLRPAEIVPVDGVLLGQGGAFDESSLTGESIPVERGTGDAVLSGSVNGQAALQIRATATAENSQYQQIVALVAAAGESKAPVVRLADRYAVPFTLFSLALAGIAWAVSGDPVRFAEVLVVATPCPLLIAAPVAFMGGMSRGARNGVIVKGGGVLEKLARARTVVFDKTGTLTHGRPSLTAVRPAPGFDADEVLALAASAEQYSSHVLAASIMRSAEERGLALRPAETAREVATHGVVATIDGRVVTIGKLSFVRAAAPDARATELSGGELSIAVAVDGRFAGSIVASDSVRGNAAATIAALRQLGVRDSMILTGDAQSTADHVAEQLGITRVQAECLPQDKVVAVRAITERPVIMVGDGVNDAPVLAAADVGIAMGAKGATAASESADVVIMVDDIARAARAVQIGQDTMRIALQSIWIGIAFSVVLMLIAAFGLIPATVGAALQEVVDLVTILNALRAIGMRRDARWSLPEARPERAPTGNITNR